MNRPLTLKTAIGGYDYTRPLKDGTIVSPRLTLEHVEIVPIHRAFRPMVKDLAFDVSELALVTHMLAVAMQRPLVGVPVVLMQQSAYASLVCRADSSLQDPRDLAGRTVGVRAYTQTTGVWLRGMLHDQFGLESDSVRWLTLEAAHVDGYVDPPNCARAAPDSSLSDLLLHGDIDAAVGLEARDQTHLRTLIAHASEVESEWVEHSGVRPINHVLVMRRDRAEAAPWLSSELTQLVRAAKDVTAQAAPVDGLEPNRRALEILARYALEQRITPRAVSPLDLFAVS